MAILNTNGEHVSFQIDGWREPTLAENLARAGVSRRDFVKYCGGLAAIFAASPALLGALPKAAAAGPEPMAPMTGEQIAETLGAVEKPVVAWLQLQECTGCVESALRSGGTTVEDAVLSLLSVDYNEAVMAAAGDAANKALHDLNQNPHILVVNGSVSTKDDGIYCVIAGESSEKMLRDSAKNASAILAVGACSVWGGVQASSPNPTGAVGVDAIIKDKPIINVAGCPPIGEVIMATIAYILTHNGALPKLDAQGRPLFAFDQRIHDSCPRRPHYDGGQYVRTFDDEAARNGWCLYEVGCKGPSTYAACPIIQWNLRTNWPIGAGHPCIGCTEKGFFDNFTPFYRTLPDVVGFGVETTAETVGLAVTGVAVAGVAAHAGLTAVRRAAGRRPRKQEQPLQAFGDESPAVTAKTDESQDATVPRRSVAAEAATTDTNSTGKAE